MDRILGSIINDYTLYKLIEGLIAILSLFMIHFGIQIALIWRNLKKDATRTQGVIPERGSFIRSTIFIFIAGIFLILHEFLEGLGRNTPDFTTFELLELIAITGMVLFLYEWYKILKNYKNKTKNIK